MGDRVKELQDLVRLLKLEEEREMLGAKMERFLSDRKRWEHC